MRDKLFFLGTAGDYVVAGRQTRASGGMVIQTEGYQFFFDPGPGALTMARKHGINVRETTAIIVSASDLLHTNDLNMLLSAMSYNGLDSQGVLICPEQIINGDHSLLRPECKTYVERIISPKSGDKIGIQEIEIETVAIKANEGTLGIKLTAPTFSCAYISQTGYSAEVAKSLGAVDVLILGVPFMKTKDQYALNVEEAVEFINRARPQVAILTSFGKEMTEINPTYAARDISKATKVHVIAAEDGMQIDPTAFAQKVRQKKLKFEEEKL